ncbi:MAG: molybdopterin molybdotransferase MoeA [Dehalococcoidales bacterium]
MISVEEALGKVLSYVSVLDGEEKSVLEGMGQVLAEDVYADFDIPPLDNSAMDGYAVRSEDTAGAGYDSPRVLSVVDTVAAGTVAGASVEPGTAMRIMTGAPVPDGADCIVRFEDTDENTREGLSGEIGILKEVKPGLDIRKAGEDISRGELVVARGDVIRPPEVGVLASLGRDRVRVVRRPVVAILATGNELVELGGKLDGGKIYNSNSYSLAALVSRYGGIPRMLGIARDIEESVLVNLRGVLGADLLVTSGGVSLGDYDVIKEVLASHGEITFWTVKMKPGKPLAFGVMGGFEPAHPEKKIPHLGLPGNPVSSMITFELFVRPAIIKMMGKTNLSKPCVEAIMEDAVVNTDGRRIYARVKVEERNGRYFAGLTGPQGSGILNSMKLANGLAVIPEDTAGVAAGDTVQVMMLDWGRE